MNIKGEDILVFIENCKIGQIIMFGYRDSDDYTTWEFKYIKGPKGRIYLGGGIDFGMGIGQHIKSNEELLEEIKEGGAYYEDGIYEYEINKKKSD